MRLKITDILVFEAVLLYCVGICAGAAYGLQPTEQLTKQPAEQLTVTSEVMFGDSERYEPEDIYEEEGALYCLQSWVIEPVEVEPRHEDVKQQILFEALEDRDTIPEYHEIRADDLSAKQSVTEEFPIIEVKENNERWSGDFSFPVVFHAYGAEYYQLGSRKVPLDVDQPALGGCEAELLEEIGVSADRYRIREITWEGTPYYDEMGVLCRNAVAAGEKLVADYLVTYGGALTFPRIQGYRCRAVYKQSEIERKPAGDKIILPESVPEPILESVPEADSGWLITRQAVVITMSLLAVVLIFLLVAWGIKKIVENRDEKRKERGQCYGVAKDERG